MQMRKKGPFVTDSIAKTIWSGNEEFCSDCAFVLSYAIFFAFKYFFKACSDGPQKATFCI